MRMKTEEQVVMRVSATSIAVNLLLSLFKLLAGIFGHSAAMISDAVHSASDVFSTVIVILKAMSFCKNRPVSFRSSVTRPILFLIATIHSILCGE